MAENEGQMKVPAHCFTSDMDGTFVTLKWYVRNVIRDYNWAIDFVIH